MMPNTEFSKRRGVPRKIGAAVIQNQPWILRKGGFGNRATTTTVERRRIRVKGVEKRRERRRWEGVTKKEWD